MLRICEQVLPVVHTLLTQSLFLAQTCAREHATQSAPPQSVPVSPVSSTRLKQCSLNWTGSGYTHGVPPSPARPALAAKPPSPATPARPPSAAPPLAAL